MNYQEIYYPESKFGGFTNVDGTIAFYTRVNSLMEASHIFLDIGCGCGAYIEDPVRYRKNLRIFKGKCTKVIGMDVDPVALSNPFLDEFRLIEGEKWPIDDESVDIAICDSVVEHVEKPDGFFSEVGRILKPGGYICIRTPNKNSYVGVISRLVPNRDHSKILTKVQTKRQEVDVFPTFYKVNTVKRIRHYLSKYGFDHCVYSYEAEPSYLSFSRFAYWLGVLHQKYAPKFFKLAIFAFGKKQN
jgi:SAM-dependent methyltransferase